MMIQNDQISLGKRWQIKDKVSQGHDKKSDKTLSVCQGSEANGSEILSKGNIISNEN